MGRKAIIDENTLLDLLDEFFIGKCNKDVSRLKIPAFADFVRMNGYEDVQDYIIRRNTAVRERMEQLKKDADHAYQSRAVVFRNLDIDSFLARNTSPASLKKALVERDHYYQQLSESAAYCIGKYNHLEEQLSKITSEKEALESENFLYAKENKHLRGKIQENQHEIQKLRAFIDTYINPEIANELLKQEGLLKTTADIVSAEAMERNVIRSDSDITPKNNIVRNLFDKI